MSGRGKGVWRRTGKATAGRERTGEREMRAAVNPAPAVEPMARRRRRAAVETTPVRDSAPTPVPGPEPEAASAAAPPAKRLRADESAGNEVWIMGDSIPYWDGQRAELQGMPDLNLPCGTRVVWMGVSGMGWADAGHHMQLPALSRMPPKHQPEVEALQEEINILNEQLDESKYEQDKQRRLIQALKDDLEEERNKKPSQIRESLDDVRTELRDMRDELYKLMGVIESKDLAIETLENQLRTSKDEIKTKSQAMSYLQRVVSDLERKNGELHESVEGVRSSVEDRLISQRSSSPASSSTSQTFLLHNI